MSDFYYLDILLEKTDEKGPEDCDLSPDELKDYILYSLRSLFGEFGASVAVDLLKITPTGAIVRVPTASCVKLRASLTLAAPFRGNSLSVRSFSSSLPGLTANSRTYCHC